MIKLLTYILFEKLIYILALETASPGNQHYASCIGALSFLVVIRSNVIQQFASRATRSIFPAAAVTQAVVRVKCKFVVVWAKTIRSVYTVYARR